ncbi:MAG: type II toxin-antitoxin system RelE/ParE family toxin [Gemmatimonadetes bacterium]|nr:type II toxin-antitoxin system RelE/ParE family toxin [Gemmatimonadota bacterium]
MPALLIRAAAETDMLLAAEWYETRAAGLGTEFVRAVDVCFGLIQRMPQGYQLVAPDVRRARLRRFPFSVYYVATPERIAILAVLHARRDPREWQSRL